MTALEKIRHLRELAVKATPRPWYFDKEGCCYGDLDHFHGDTTNPAVIEPVTGNRVDIGQADANYIAAAANLLPALVDLAEAALGWSDDTGECHFCDLGWPAYKPDLFHDEDCPVLLLERALESDRG
jgi:hypothetical protein